MVEFEIDGKKVSAEEGSMIIEAADAAGIYIPRFCYHKKLSIAANCRMCLIEVEKVGKPLPACATPVTPDMKVYTTSEKALQAQRAVMQFLLINHPLDCPICDQGGECELQDLAMGYGSHFSYYEEPKRAVSSHDIGPLIETEMTRCIHCTRCVRFGEEVANLRELGATGRGEQMEIGTYVKHFLKSEISGNVIDLCPVGALTAKPWRYEARGWELQEHPSVAPHDCVGSNIYLHSRGRALVPQRVVMRCVPRENEQINETWISDRDRFAMTSLYHEDRVYQPRQKINGKWVEVTWQEVLPEIAKRLRAIIEQQGADQLAALASPNSSVEELYLLQKLFRQLGSHNLDHRYRQTDFSDDSELPSYLGLDVSLSDIETKDVILLVGANVRFAQPLLAHRINKATQEGAAVVAINPVDFPFTFPVAEKMISADLVSELAAVVAAVAKHKQHPIVELSAVIPSAAAEKVAAKLLAAQHPMIILGTIAADHPQAAKLRALAAHLASMLNAATGQLTHGANSAGAAIAGMLPHRGAFGEAIELPGFNARQLFTTDTVKAYLLHNIEVENDVAFPASALLALKQAELVVCLTTFATTAMDDYADFILPLAPHSEYAGTFVNAAGDWQSFTATGPAHQQAKPAWKIYRVLANLLELSGFDHLNPKHILHEIKEKSGELSATLKPIAIGSLEPVTADYRLATWPMYRVDGMVRRSQALQSVFHEQQQAVVRINSNSAQKFNVVDGQEVTVKQGAQTLVLAIAIDDAIADHVIYLPSGLDITKGFGEAYGVVTLEAQA